MDGLASSLLHFWRRTPKGGFFFASILLILIKTLGYLGIALYGLGWFVGVVWSLINLVQSVRGRNGLGVALGVAGIAFSCANWWMW